jgi:CheY-like chemotaxis protein
VLDKVKKLQKFKLLFVEDEESLIDIISETLNKLEFNFLIAHNGEEGLKFLEQHDDIDVIITDLNMPVMTGIEMIK